jgi:hypothetical protein
MPRARIMISDDAGYMNFCKECWSDLENVLKNQDEYYYNLSDLETNDMLGLHHQDYTKTAYEAGMAYQCNGCEKELSSKDNSLTAGKSATCYLNKIAFDHELGEDAWGTKLYKSEKATFNFPGCGLVKVKVFCDEVVEPMDMKAMRETAIPAEESRKRDEEREADPDWHKYWELREKFDKEYAFHKNRK